MEFVEYLYNMRPDRIYWHRNGESWYACYDDWLCLLTNASGKLESYCFDNKVEYREARTIIVEKYNLKRGKVATFNDEDE